MLIYGLTDPINHELRYVGFTTKSLSERLRGHLKNQSLRKLNYDDAEDIVKKYRSGTYAKIQLSVEYKVSLNTISRVVNERTNF